MSLAESIAKLKPVNVVVVGDAMLDRYVFGSATRLSPEAPVPVLKFEREEFCPGGAANVAKKIVELGARAQLYCAMGEDQARVTLAAELECVPSVPTIHLITERTTEKTRFVVARQQLLRMDSEITTLVESGLDELAGQIVEGMFGADALVVSDYNKGVCTKKLLKCAFEVACKKRIPIIIDPCGTNYHKYACAGAVLVPNEHETYQVAGANMNLKVAAEILRIRTDAVLVAVTRGEKGIDFFYPDGSMGKIEAHPVEVFDVTGAGDVVTATLAVALASGLEYPQALSLANLAGGIIVTQLGTGTISKEMLLEAAKTYEKDVSKLGGRKNV